MRRKLIAMSAGAVLAVAMALSAAPLAQATPTSPQPAGELTDFGPQLKDLTVSQAIAGVGPGGRPAMYTLQQGTPGAVGVVDPVSKELLANIPLSGSGGWGISQAPAGGAVYVGTYNDARLWSIDPETFAATDLGTPVPGEVQLYSLTTTADGRVFGGTYPNGHAWSYSPTAGFTDYGKLHPDGSYARGVAVDPDGTTLWAGMGLRSHLIKLDIATGQRTDVWPAALRGNADHPYDVTYANGRVLVRTNEYHLVVLDADTDAVVMSDMSASSITSRGTTTVSPDGTAVYFNRFVTGSGVELWRYNLLTDTVEAVRSNAGAPLIPSPRMGIIGSGWINGVLYAKAGNYDGTTFWYNPVTNTTGRDVLPVPPQALPLQGVSIGPDGRVFTGGYINGTVLAFDPVAETTATVGRFAQPESWVWHDGIAYVGTYPAAGLLAYNPAAPYASGTNPRSLLSLQTSHGQSRVVASAAAAGSIFIGSTPDYGRYGGALTKVNPTTGAFDVQQNIVQDQAIYSLAAHDGSVWGGSAIFGGGVTMPPVASAAVLFEVDPVTGQKVSQYVPVAGAQKISALVTGPDGLLWGLADHRLFRFDTQTRTVVSVTPLPVTPGHLNYDRMFVNPNGSVYASIGRQLIQIDPQDYSFEVLFAELGRKSGLAQDADGDLWFVSGTNDTRLYRYAPGTSQLPAPAAVSSPTIVGTPAVGSLLSAQPGEWDTEGLAFTYQWQSSGAPIEGATGDTFVVDGGHNGADISVAVVASADGRASTTATSGTVSVANEVVWSANATYRAGDTVLHGGQVYKAEWYAHGDVPGASATGPWAARGVEAQTTTGIVRTWEPTRIYSVGDTVLHDGQVYRASWWTRDNAPGDSNGPWKALS